MEADLTEALTTPNEQDGTDDFTYDDIQFNVEPPGDQMDESNMSGLDLYTDMVVRDSEEAALSMAKLKEEKKSFKSQLDVALIEVSKLTKVNEALTKENQVLRSNISVLLKTAKMEIQRKERELNELREQQMIGKGSVGPTGRGDTSAFPDRRPRSRRLPTYTKRLERRRQNGSHQPQRAPTGSIPSNANQRKSNSDNEQKPAVRETMFVQRQRAKDNTNAKAFVNPSVDEPKSTSGKLEDKLGQAKGNVPNKNDTKNEVLAQETVKQGEVSNVIEAVSKDVEKDKKLADEHSRSLDIRSRSKPVEKSVRSVIEEKISRSQQGETCRQKSSSSRSKESSATVAHRERTSRSRSHERSSRSKSCDRTSRSRSHDKTSRSKSRDQSPRSKLTSPEKSSRSEHISKSEQSVESDKKKRRESRSDYDSKERSRTTRESDYRKSRSKYEDRARDKRDREMRRSSTPIKDSTREAEKLREKNGSSSRQHGTARDKRGHHFERDHSRASERLSSIAKESVAKAKAMLNKRSYSSPKKMHRDRRYMYPSDSPSLEVLRDWTCTDGEKTKQAKNSERSKSSKENESRNSREKRSEVTKRKRDEKIVSSRSQKDELNSIAKKRRDGSTSDTIFNKKAGGSDDNRLSRHQLNAEASSADTCTYEECHTVLACGTKEAIEATSSNIALLHTSVSDFYDTTQSEMSMISITGVQGNTDACLEVPDVVPREVAEREDGELSEGEIVSDDDAKEAKQLDVDHNAKKQKSQHRKNRHSPKSKHKHHAKGKHSTPSNSDSSPPKKSVTEKRSGKAERKSRVKEREKHGSRSCSKSKGKKHKRRLSSEGDAKSSKKPKESRSSSESESQVQETSKEKKELPDGSLLANESTEPTTVEMEHSKVEANLEDKECDEASAEDGSIPRKTLARNIGESLQSGECLSQASTNGEGVLQDLFEPRGGDYGNADGGSHENSSVPDRAITLPADKPSGDIHEGVTKGSSPSGDKDLKSAISNEATKTVSPSIQPTFESVTELSSTNECVSFPNEGLESDANVSRGILFEDLCLSSSMDETSYLSCTDQASENLRNSFLNSVEKLSDQMEHRHDAVIDARVLEQNHGKSAEPGTEYSSDHIDHLPEMRTDFQNLNEITDKSRDNPDEDDNLGSRLSAEEVTTEKAMFTTAMLDKAGAELGQNPTPERAMSPPNPCIQNFSIVSANKMQDKQHTDELEDAERSDLSEDGDVMSVHADDDLDKSLVGSMNKDKAVEALQLACDWSNLDFHDSSTKMCAEQSSVITPALAPSFDDACARDVDFSRQATGLDGPESKAGNSLVTFGGSETLCIDQVATREDKIVKGVGTFGGGEEKVACESVIASKGQVSDAEISLATSRLEEDEQESRSRYVACEEKEVAQDSSVCVRYYDLSPKPVEDCGDEEKMKCNIDREFEEHCKDHDENKVVEKHPVTMAISDDDSLESELDFEEDEEEEYVDRRGKCDDGNESERESWHGSSSESDKDIEERDQVENHVHQSALVPQVDEGEFVKGLNLSEAEDDVDSRGKAVSSESEEERDIQGEKGVDSDAVTTVHNYVSVDQKICSETEHEGEEGNRDGRNEAVDPISICNKGLHDVPQKDSQSTPEDSFVDKLLPQAGHPNRHHTSEKDQPRKEEKTVQEDGEISEGEILSDYDEEIAGKKDNSTAYTREEGTSSHRRYSHRDHRSDHPNATKRRENTDKGTSGRVETHSKRGDRSLDRKRHREEDKLCKERQIRDREQEWRLREDEDRKRKFLESKLRKIDKRREAERRKVTAPENDRRKDDRKESRRKDEDRRNEHRRKEGDRRNEEDRKREERRRGEEEGDGKSTRRPREERRDREIERDPKDLSRLTERKREQNRTARKVSEGRKS